jgi:4-carboxymuconolactone decarboxylase
MMETTTPYRRSTAAMLMACLGLLAPTSQAQAPADAPTQEQLRAAVAALPPGRIERPASYDTMTPEQQRYLQSVLAGPRSAVSGPLVVMLASPTLGDLAQRTMAYARFAGTDGFSSVPQKLNELAILMAAKAWSSPYVWEAHDRYAVRVGLPPALVDAVRTGGAPPAGLEPDVAAVYRFLDEFLRTREVGDATYDAARAALGSDRAVVDLIGTLAIYQMSAMLTAIDRTGLEGDAPAALRPLE